MPHELVPSGEIGVSYIPTFCVSINHSCRRQRSFVIFEKEPCSIYSLFL